MKKFLKKLTVFSILVFAINTSVFIAVVPAKEDVPAAISTSRNILIAGDSRTERSLNDSIFNKATNISQSAELYMYTYVKLRTLLAHNPQIDTVLLSFSHTSLTKLTDKWYTDEGLINERLGSYLPMMNFEEIAEAVFRAPATCIEAMVFNFKIYINDKLGNKKHKSFSDLGIGKYLFIRGELSQHKADSVKDFFSKLSTVSQPQVNYLNKIISLCKKQNIKLILIITPMPRKYYDLNRKILQHYKGLFPNADYADFSEFELADSCFHDPTHLNYKGARIFSTYLSKTKKPFSDPAKQHNHSAWVW